MRFISYKAENKSTWGVCAGDNIYDMGIHLGGTLKEAVTAEKLAECSEYLDQPSHELSEVTLLPPITAPEKIICIGVNYANRNSEYKDGSAPPEYPSVFMRAPDSMTGHRQALLRPPESDQLDYEGEIGVVIGKTGRRIKQSDAMDYIAGLTVINEGTIRDWVRHAKFNVTQGKNFYHSGACGPWMVSADEFSAEQLTDMQVKTWVNGELRQDDTTANMMFPIAYQISYLSTFFTLKPGDIIATGTPNGAGARFTPPKFLVPGDEVVVEVDGVGRLVNPIADEQEIRSL